MSNNPFEFKIEHQQVFLRFLKPCSVSKILEPLQYELFQYEVEYLPDRLLKLSQNQSQTWQYLCEFGSRLYQYEVRLSQGHHEAYLTIVPPFHDDIEPPTFEELHQVLKHHGVLSGILESECQKMLQDEIFYEPCLVAKSSPAVQGNNGKLQIIYPADKHFHHLQQINYREKGTLRTVVQGEWIARLIPPTTGQDGWLVNGQILSAKAGKPCRVYAGKGVTYNQDTHQFHTESAGFLLFDNKRLSVENILRVPCVNPEIGNLNFDGKLYIEGDVEDGYEVRATQGIEVKGVVGKSLLETDGSLYIHGGVWGATLRAKQIIFFRFACDAKVQHARHIYIQHYATHCDLEAEVSVKVKAQDGFIYGGKTRAGLLISLPNAGSEKWEVTSIFQTGLSAKEAQTLASTKQQAKQLEEFKRLRHQYIKHRQNINPKPFQTLCNNLHAQARLQHRFKETGHSFQDGVILVNNHIFQGSQIQIGQAGYLVQTALKHVAFIAPKSKVTPTDIDDLDLQKFLIAKSHHAN